MTQVIMVNALGTDLSRLAHNLEETPRILREKAEEIACKQSELRHLREILREEELPLRFKATVDGRNEAMRNLQFDELAQHSERIQECRRQIAAVELQIDSLEAQRDEALERSRNARALAHLIAAWLPGNVDGEA